MNAMKRDKSSPSQGKAKKAKTDDNDQPSADVLQAPREVDRPSPSSEDRDSSPSSIPTTPTRLRVSNPASTPTRRITPTFFHHGPTADVAAQKMAASSPTSLSVLGLPYHRGSLATHSGPFPERNLSREEFRQFFIRTIEEALRIINDKPDDETPLSRKSRPMN